MVDFLRLRFARVQNFCCFEDSGEVRIDDVTVLLAENENGKTAFLRALAWFSSEEDFDEDDRWSEADPSRVLDVVSLLFELTKDAANALADEGFPKPKLVRITKSTDGVYRVDDAETRGPLERVGKSAEELFQDTRDWLIKILRKHDLTAAQAAVEALEDATAEDEVAEAVATNVRENVAPGLDSSTGTTLNEKLEELVRWEAAANDEDGDPDAYDLLEPFLPRLIYFIDLDDRVVDEAPYNEVSNDPSGWRTMINLAKLVDVDLNGVAGVSGHRRLKLSQEASDGLTEQASLRWDGDRVSFRVQFDESRMLVSVEHKGRDQKPSRRSRGLQWFLGFYANFKAEARGDLAGAILLLDEPGLHLHIKQQSKLIGLFEELTDSNQIVYSTHLPFLVPRGTLHRLRLMVAGKTKGTVRVENDFHKMKTSADVMQPVRAALGLGIADAISLGRANVVVEGLADTYYLDAMRAFCREAAKPTLGDDVTVLASGGAGAKMLPLVSFLIGERARGAVLLDDDRAGHVARRKIEKNFYDLIPIVFTNPAAGKTPNGLAIEDLFDRDYFIDLLNDSYTGVPGFSDLTRDDLDAAKPMCEAVKEAFQQGGIGGFEKLRPARQLQLRLKVGEKPPDDPTLDAFAEVFGRLTEALARST